MFLPKQDTNKTKQDTNENIGLLCLWQPKTGKQQHICALSLYDGAVWNHLKTYKYKYKYTLRVKDYTKNGLWVTQKGISFTSVGQHIVFGLLGHLYIYIYIWDIFTILPIHWNPAYRETTRHILIVY